MLRGLARAHTMWLLVTLALQRGRLLPRFQAAGQQVCVWSKKHTIESVQLGIRCCGYS